ncbi:hypothetical protein LZ30DRAFT_252155 [Colletotrichum cereale]|nr:hypothetical protein LZ30DRAFT_252155 [Colletotrichum cereale]
MRKHAVTGVDEGRCIILATQSCTESSAWDSQRKQAFTRGWSIILSLYQKAGSEGLECVGQPLAAPVILQPRPKVSSLGCQGHRLGKGGGGGVNFAVHRGYCPRFQVEQSRRSYHACSRTGFQATPDPITGLRCSKKLTAAAAPGGSQRSVWLWPPDRPNVAVG